MAFSIEGQEKTIANFIHSMSHHKNAEGLIYGMILKTSISFTVKFHSRVIHISNPEICPIVCVYSKVITKLKVTTIPKSRTIIRMAINRPRGIQKFEYARRDVVGIFQCEYETFHRLNQCHIVFDSLSHFE
jgi:hypothetical protein